LGAAWGARAFCRRSKPVADYKIGGAESAGGTFRPLRFEQRQSLLSAGRANILSRSRRGGHGPRLRQRISQECVWSADFGATLNRHSCLDPRARQTTHDRSWPGIPGDSRCCWPRRLIESGVRWIVHVNWPPASRGDNAPSTIRILWDHARAKCRHRLQDVLCPASSERELQAR